MAVEQFNNYAQTTLSVAALSSDTTLSVVSVAGWPTTGNFRLRIDDPLPLTTFEYVLVTSVNVGANQVTCTRAQENTTAIAHPIGAIMGNDLTASALTTGFTRLDTAASQTMTGPLVIPYAIAAATTPTTSYGTFAIKLDDILVGTDSRYPAATAQVTFLNTSNSGTNLLPTGFRHLLVEIQVRSDTAANAQECGVRFNNDSGANYAYQRTNVSGTGAPTDQESGVTGQTSGRDWFVTAANSLAGAAGVARIWIPNYNGATFKKSSRLEVSHFAAAAFLTAGQLAVDSLTHFWNNTAAITRLDILPLAGNFISGSLLTLYGIP